MMKKNIFLIIFILANGFNNIKANEQNDKETYQIKCCLICNDDKKSRYFHDFRITKANIIFDLKAHFAQELKLNVEKIQIGYNKHALLKDSYNLVEILEMSKVTIYPIADLYFKGSHSGETILFVYA